MPNRRDVRREVSGGDDADDVRAVDDGQVVVARLDHLVGGAGDRFVPPYRDHVAAHHRGDGRRRALGSLGDDAHEVGGGEDAHQLTAVDHDDRPDVVVEQHCPRFSERRVSVHRVDRGRHQARDEHVFHSSYYATTQHNAVASGGYKCAPVVRSGMYDVLVVGGGAAGLSVATFTARADLETLVLDAGGSILQRNAHLENYPGFPAGVNARQLLDLFTEGVERAGAERRDAEVTRIEAGAPFVVETADSETYRAERIVAATKNAVDYLPDGVELVDRGKSFVVTDERGRTDVPGLYAAGRLAGKPHQAVVSAGHGGEVAVTLLEDADQAFYHDWVAPEGYFTDRGRDLPPGCEEIDDDERRRREDAARELMRERLAAPHPSDQPTHPSLE